MFRLLILAAFLNLQLAFKTQAQGAREKLTYRGPENGEYTPGFLTAFGNEINKAVPSIGSFAVWRHNALIYERYFHGATDSTLFNVKSITKSIVSAIGGIAKDKGLLPDLKTPFFEYSNRICAANILSG